MRTEKKIAIIVASVMLALGLIMAAASFRGFISEIKSSADNSEFTEQTKEISDSFEDIDLHIMDQDISILKSDNGKAYLVCYESEKVKYDVSVSGKTLKIEEKARRSFFDVDDLWSFGKSYHSKLYLPEDKYNNINARVGSGDLLIEDFEADSMQLKTGSGDIAAENLKCRRELSAEVGSGKIFLTEVNVSASLKAHTGSGDIILKSVDGMNIDLSTGSGDITGSVRTAKSFDAHAGSGDVDVPADGNGGNCVIKTGSGDISITVD